MTSLGRVPTASATSARASSRGRFPLVCASVALVVAAAGCGAPSEQAAGGGNAPGNAEVAVGGSQFGAADAATAALGSDAADGVFPRTVKHANGSTEIAAQPKRVVVLDTGEMDAVISLGVTPVGIPTMAGANSVPSYLKDKVADAKQVGAVSELNLEAIAALKPDLILGSQLRADKVYTQLSAIAPTVFAIRPGFPWKENFALVGDSLGMEAQARQVMSSYEQKVTALNESVEGDPTISLVRFMPGKLRLYANKSLIGVILKDAGLKRPANQDVDDLAVEISPENISQADADVIFYSSYGEPDATGETSVINGTQWQQMSAVKAGNAHRVDDDVWFLGLGPTGAGIIVDQLGGFLAKK
ncbi:iron complex transport system substrate-binding protein [Kineosphaera limosa]|uniref:Putative iron-siderophore binding protein n=1 Tax=Kineosphaera limosa NBRC 100340 TaxID=1184609 RepID=K6X9V4_9MICO|nr:iron-siderophore ABC transporter substrate-binding protein [Kineosphaera limosa]NYD99664.1 iron complex transport system substrate-binding protein [Kineosphaera limosa]GAB95619.1 putative iron-siderophore binding protein [Kineosphaera limosa NBRC 100340]